MSGINRRKEILAIIVLLEHSGMQISKTAQTGQDYEVASSQKSAIIYNDGAPKNNKNAAGPHDMSGSPEIRGPYGKKIKLEHNPSDYKNVTPGTGAENSGHVVGNFEGKEKKMLISKSTLKKWA